MLGTRIGIYIFNWYNLLEYKQWRLQGFDRARVHTERRGPRKADAAAVDPLDELRVANWSISTGVAGLHWTQAGPVTRVLGLRVRCGRGPVAGGGESLDVGAGLSGLLTYVFLFLMAW